MKILVAVVLLFVLVVVSCSKAASGPAASPTAVPPTPTRTPLPFVYPTPTPTAVTPVTPLPATLTSANFEVVVQSLKCVRQLNDVLVDLGLTNARAMYRMEVALTIYSYEGIEVGNKEVIFKSSDVPAGGVNVKVPKPAVLANLTNTRSFFCGVFVHGQTSFVGAAMEDLGGVIGRIE